ncbi:podocalyxin [Oncorhynchus kisutch]|uniref:Podocalyxin n=1 Tax=Oncorhynchus kisutch TaxID=8019 RepID=A0A8C7KEV4_ONCKI|nr:podocalyxin [Oncorhynchus kisutch]
MKQSFVKKNRMETKMRITWALLPLGFLLHCTHADPTLVKSPTSEVNISTIHTPVSDPVTNSTQNDISTHTVTSSSLINGTGTTLADLTVPSGAALSTFTAGRSSGNVESTTMTPAGLDFTSSTGTHTQTTTSSTGTDAQTTTSSTGTDAQTTTSSTETNTTAQFTSSSGTLTQTTTSSTGTDAQTTTSSTGTDAQTTISSTETHTTAQFTSSSGTLTQTTTSSAGTPHSTAVTPVGGRHTPILTTPWSRLSSPSQQPSTSSPVGSGSSFAITTTRAQGGMVLTTMAETTTTTATTTSPPKSFMFVMSKRNEENHEKKDLEALCRHLMSQMHDANCTLAARENNGQTTVDSVVITGKVDNAVVQQYYEEITRKQSDNMTLIAIVASCGALLAMIVGFALYAVYHRKSYRKNHQQHLTEEMQTVENGYHDNPTLEVMEVQQEMQEKKVALNGEFNDSWIVPIDNLLKEDMPDEEDTHL